MGNTASNSVNPLTLIEKPENDIRLRECRFEPEKHYISVSYAGRPEEAYLEVKWRTFWFNVYCAEHGIRGYIDDSEVEIRPDVGLIKATATVYMDGEVAGKSSSGYVMLGGPESNLGVCIQNACTSAKGRALANAGFGTIVSSEPKEGLEFPCDSGIMIGADGTMSFKNAPDPTQAPPTEKPKRGRKKTAVSAETPIQSELPKQPGLSPEPAAPRITFTVDEARKYVLPMGSMEGKTMGEALVAKRNMVEWYASDAFSGGNYPEVKIAAQTLLQAGL